MLSWFSSWTGSYAIALLFYALIFKILFMFFSVKQQKNQIAMAKLAPKIELIKAKYKGRNDQATLRKQQEEIMQLQQKEGYSPLSGCLPLLLQLPIIIILYNVIRNPLSHILKLSEEVVIKINTIVYGLEADAAFSSIDQITLTGKMREYITEFGAGTLEAASGNVITGIDVLPNFELWGINLAPVPTFTSILVLIPFLAAGFQWLTMFVTKKLNGNMASVSAEQNEQSQMSLKIMDLIMPLMTLWITFSFSAMMGLYWIFQSVLAIAQTVILSLVMPVPKYTAEEIKAMHKEQKAQQKAQKAIIKTQPKYKSLHYIDDEDYDELPEMKTSAPAQKNLSSGDAPEIKD